MLSILACAVWQPVLAHGLKETFTKDPITLGKLRAALGPSADDRIDNIKDIFDYDSEIVVSLNGFKDVYHYYHDISATDERIKSGLKVPLLLLSAIDDPITHVDCSPSFELHDPSPLSEHLFALITDKGGHVGWPLGWRPWIKCWEFQSTLALEFLEGVISAGDLLGKNRNRTDKQMPSGSDTK